MKKVVLAGAILFFCAEIASAHVVVKPSEVGVGTFETFSIGVPVEKNVGTVGVRLVVPPGLDYVMPNVKPGWNVTVKKEGQGTSTHPTEIIWSGGFIPAGQRDDFLFSAKVPSATTTLVWKAYQTYQGGAVVAWDASAENQPKDAAGAPDFSRTGPYSETKVIDDLAEDMPEKTNNNSASTALTFSLVSLVFSITAVSVARRNKA